jgi:WD40 repeat protein
MQVWDLKEDREVKSLGSNQDYSGVVVMTADGSRALTGDGYGRVRLWDLKQGKELYHRPDNVSEAYCVALSPPDGRLALTGYRELVILYDVRSGQIVKRRRDKGGRIISVAFSPDGSRFAYGNDQGKLYLCKTETGEELWSELAHRSFYVRGLIFSPDGKRLYSGGGRVPPGKVSEEIGAIRVWDSATGKPVGQLRGHTGGVQSLALSPDGKQILSGAEGFDKSGHTVRLWDRASGKQRACFERCHCPVTGIAFAPNGKRFVAAMYGQSIMQDLEATSAKAVRLTVQGTRAVTFVDERQFVTAENDRQFVLCGDDGKVISGRFQSYLVNGLALSKDGKYLATANSNGTVYILRLPLKMLR